MKAVSLLVLTGLSAFFAGPALAQCPAGIPSGGNPSCIPPSAWPQNAPAQQAVPAPPSWKLTWGAIAIDLDSGDVGTAVGKPSKRKAEREALDRCQASGATGCKKVLFSYQNQCAVIAWPAVVGVGAGVIAQSGASVAAASEIALKRCAGTSVGDSGKCRIVYSECSDPVLVSR
ncbi:MULTISPECIES: DUF4189 domain-containing protein [Lysobacter]|uniref:DUF4189 domain-containing protein n=1 Tax=Lysobacter TaxID=68 RepID=UPI0009DE1DD2